MEKTIPGLILYHHCGLLKQGAVVADELDPGEDASYPKRVSTLTAMRLAVSGSAPTGSDLLEYSRNLWRSPSR